MLEIDIPEWEHYDEETNEFSYGKPTKLVLEHSLLSISKWESKWKKPFLSRDNKTVEEFVDYVRCMTLNKNVDPNCYFLLTTDDIKKIDAYINDSMTATWFSDKNASRSREIVTSEVIYYWMAASQIPFECEKWHLNRLLTLIRVYSEKSAPPKKMSKKSLMRRNTALNEARKKSLGTKG